MGEGGWVGWLFWLRLALRLRLRLRLRLVGGGGGRGRGGVTVGSLLLEVGFVAFWGERG